MYYFWGGKMTTELDYFGDQLNFQQNGGLGCFQLSMFSKIFLFLHSK